jgi:hypothetical protein
MKYKECDSTIQIHSKNSTPRSHNGPVYKSIFYKKIAYKDNLNVKKQAKVK